MFYVSTLYSTTTNYEYHETHWTFDAGLYIVCAERTWGVGYCTGLILSQSSTDYTTDSYVMAKAEGFPVRIFTWMNFNSACTIYLWVKAISTGYGDESIMHHKVERQSI